MARARTPGTATTSNVLAALYTLHDRRQRWNITAEDIANYLRVPESVVLTHLRTLKRERLIDDRRRQGKRVWMTWAAAN